MKLVFVFVSAILFSHYTSAQPHKCVFANGSVVETKFPCDPVMIEKFGTRLTELYPDVGRSSPSDEVMKNLYVMAMGTCDEPFTSMTPEQVGRNMEPFFPWQMGASMAQAAREIICPAGK